MGKETIIVRRGSMFGSALDRIDYDRINFDIIDYDRIDLCLDSTM